MSTIQKLEGKSGPSYKITVTQGRDINGKQMRHYKTWVPARGMTDRQMEKEVQKVAFSFEKDIELGFQADNRQTFAEYAEYVLGIKERTGCKYRTLERYRELLARINPAIGHIKLSELRPQHLNALYKNLSEAGISRVGDKAQAKDGLAGLVKRKYATRTAAATAVGIAQATVTSACQGKKIALTTAEAIARVLGVSVKSIFEVEKGTGALSSKTILEHHRLIHTVLSQAEREMVVPYNAAAKATPPKVTQKEVNYFQIDDILRIRTALEQEPIRWRLATHLLLITGCRRGEVMGLQWSRVDFQNSQIKIDTTLLYSPNRGIYEDSTKTSTVRFIKLPAETMELLRDYRRWYTELKLKNGDRWQRTGWSGSDFLFVKEDGTPMIPDGITAWLGEFSKRHGLPHINPHAFRHTMASVLINSGKDVVSVSKRLGHAKVSTTTDIYSHIIAEADEEASDCLADVLLRPAIKAANG
ncbi:MAG: site-specific integrase [Bacteroides sp.]